VLAGVEVEHEPAERPHQPRAEAAKEREARAGDLGAGGQIEDAERLAQLPVGPRLESEDGPLAPGPHDPVGRRVPVGETVGGKVGHRLGAALELSLDLAKARVQLLHLVAARSEVGHQVVGRLLGALPPSHLLACGVALGLQGLHLHQELAPLAVEIQQRVEQRPERWVATAQQRGAAGLGIVAQALEVDHAFSWPAGREEGP
jgi:hypothetical protein